MNPLYINNKMERELVSNTLLSLRKIEHLIQSNFKPEYDVEERSQFLEKRYNTVSEMFDAIVNRSDNPKDFQEETELWGLDDIELVKPEVMKMLCEGYQPSTLVKEFKLGTQEPIEIMANEDESRLLLSTDIKELREILARHDSKMNKLLGKELSQYEDLYSEDNKSDKEIYSQHINKIDNFILEVAFLVRD